MTPKPMKLIVCVDAALGIGKDNAIPWHLPKEFKHFVATTTTTADPTKVNAVLMGRRCWESIPQKFRPLKGRLNVVISQTLPEAVEDTLIVVPGYKQAIDLLNNVEPFRTRVETIWNIGGLSIYAVGLKDPATTQLVMTRINHTFDTDVKFPDVDWSEFVPDGEFPGSEEVEEKGFTYTITSYKRVAVKEN